MADINVFRRYEKKFLMDEPTMQRLLPEIREHMEPDKFCRDGQTYEICNLYFDTDGYDVIRESLSKPFYKEKLRIRSYGAWKHPEQGPETDTFTSTRLVKAYSLANDPIFPYLMENASFRRQFVNTYLDLGNEVYNGKRLRTEMNQFARDIKEAGNLESARYPTAEYIEHRYEPDYPGDLGEACDQIAAYFEQRLAYASVHLGRYFDLTGRLVDVTIENNEPAGGTVKLGTITPTLDDSNSWTGSYYSDYTVDLAAEPEDGWAFEGWTVSKNGSMADLGSTETELAFTGPVKVEAVFRKEY